MGRLNLLDICWQGSNLALYISYHELKRIVKFIITMSMYELLYRDSLYIKKEIYTLMLLKTLKPDSEVDTTKPGI